MRRLAIFNIGYGLLGLLSTLLLATVMPVSPLPRPMMVSGAIASAYILALGIVMLIWGDRLLKALKAFAARSIARALDTRPGRALTMRTRPMGEVPAPIARRLDAEMREGD